MSETGSGEGIRKKIGIILKSAFGPTKSPGFTMEEAVPHTNEMERKSDEWLKKDPRYLLDMKLLKEERARDPESRLIQILENRLTLLSTERENKTNLLETKEKNTNPTGALKLKPQSV